MTAILTRIPSACVLKSIQNNSKIKCENIHTQNLTWTHFNHSFERDKHRSEKFADCQQMKESREVEDIADGEQPFTHVDRVPSVPVVAVYNSTIYAPIKYRYKPLK